MGGDCDIGWSLRDEDRREWSGLCDLRQVLQQGRCGGCDLCGRSLAARESGAE